MWAGVDVGGRRKGFHVAIVSDGGLVAGPERRGRVVEAAAWLRAHGPELVAVDSPRSPAPDGSRSRSCERDLARAVCGIRYTPERALLADNPYYEWILRGFELYELLEQDVRVIECFPTASWTRWFGPRGTTTRAAWSRAALATFELADVPARLNQDGRDAIGAALTARAYDDGLYESFGEIVVPRGS